MDKKINQMPLNVKFIQILFSYDFLFFSDEALNVKGQYWTFFQNH